MEMQKVAVLASLWEESSDNFRTEIFARLPVEFVYNYRMICKQWNDFLFSNYFLTKWAEVHAPLNSEQPRLVLFNRNHELPIASFCFYTRTWIKSPFCFSFLEGCCCTMCSEEGIYCEDSAGGLLLVGTSVACNRRMCGRLCNPYTRTFIDIPAPQSSRHSDCLVVNKKRCGRGTSYKAKVIAVGDSLDANGVFQRHMLEIYEPSQMKWTIAGYFPENLRLNPYSDIIYFNGAFYTYYQKDIVRFTIPLEENGANPIPIPIAVHLLPFPQILQNTNEFLLSPPQIIKCSSRLLLVAAKRIPIHVEQVGGDGEGYVEMEMESVIILLELNSTEEGDEWVEIAQMPSFLLKEWTWTNQPSIDYEFDLNDDSEILLRFLWKCCIGVGDHVCFVPGWVLSSPVVKVVVYNLSDNTWDWLPHCPESYFDDCEGEDEDDAPYSILYRAIALEPSPHIRVK